MKPLIFFGDAVKALDDNGKVGGYLVRFSDDGKRKDLAGEYFTSQTYLGARDGDGVDVLFHHGQPLPIKLDGLSATAKEELATFQRHIFAPVRTQRTGLGIWAETVLKLADEYERAVFGLVKGGKLGWSSGALGHQVMKSSDGQIIRWIIGEASMTPTPAEPLNRALALDALSTVKFFSINAAESPPALWEARRLYAKFLSLQADLALIRQ
jgi:hypothetical protein